MRKQTSTPHHPSGFAAPAAPFANRFAILAADTPHSAARVRARMPRYELLAWSLFACIAALAFLAYARHPSFGNDGYQYLSVADNLRHGNGIRTSIVYYDAERSQGVIPAPAVTFPPGYSMLVALGSFIGISGEAAAVGISQLSFALLPMILGLMAPPSVRTWPLRLSMVLLVFSLPLLTFANAVGSDMLFTLVVSAGLLCFSRAMVARRAMAWQTMGSLFIGLSYGIRYAGLFVFGGISVFFAVRALTHRTRSAFVLWSASLLSLVPIAAAMARNVALTGTWRGGVSKAAFSVSQLSVRPLLAALYHTVFGESKLTANPGLVLFLMGGCGLLALWFRRRPAFKASNPVARMIGFVIVFYCAALLYADLTMVISLGARYLVPLLPAFFLLLAWWLSTFDALRVGSRVVYCLAAILLAGYLILQGRALAVSQPNAPHLDVLNALERHDGGSALASWMTANLSPGEVVTAANGQASAFVLKHPVLCLSDAPFTRTVWTRDVLLQQMQRYHSRFLIVYPRLRPGVAPVQEDSPFVRDLLASSAAPAGFEVAARNSAVIVFRRTAAF